LQLVKLPGSGNFEEISSLAIAISGDSRRRHTGLIFRPDAQPVQLIHLGWHGLLERETPPPQEYCWVAINAVHPVVLDNIADWLPQVWRENGRHIPYSIKPYDQDPFDENGKLRTSLPGEGFTCATFVLWIFHHFRVSLIDQQGWQDRPDDRLWRQWIVQMLDQSKVKYNIPEDHIAAQAPFIRQACRFRPEEVAGAAAKHDGKAADFQQVLAYGEQVLAEMRDLGRLPQAA
jgi:hypothetical protein